MLQVAFGQSKYYSDNLSENVKRGMRQKLRRGEWLNIAPVGYVNNPENTKYRTGSGESKDNPETSIEEFADRNTQPGKRKAPPWFFRPCEPLRNRVGQISGSANFIKSGVYRTHYEQGRNLPGQF